MPLEGLELGKYCLIGGDGMGDVYLGEKARSRPLPRPIRLKPIERERPEEKARSTPPPRLAQLKPIEREKSEQKGKREWIDQGDRAFRMGFYQAALDNYYQAAKLDPGDTSLRAKIDEVQGHVREDEELERRLQTKRSPIAVRVILTIFLFLIINAVAGWNLAIFVFTTILGIIALLLLVFRAPASP
jgi:hypothetical protein